MQKDTVEEARPSPLGLGLCLLFAVSVCSSAGVVFDILTTRKGVHPCLAVFWRLLIQNTVQFIPFILSLKKEWRNDQEKKMLNYHEETLELQLETTSSKEQDRGNAPKHNHEDELLPRYLKSLPLCCVSGFFLGGTLFNVGLFSQLYFFNTFSAVGFNGSNCYQWLELVSSSTWEKSVHPINIRHLRFCNCVST